MNYGEIKICDIANGPDVRVSLFVSGCTHHCKNCFNPQTWDFNYGTPFTEETEEYIIDSLRSDYINGLTILGGEPFEPYNQKALLPFLKSVREEYPSLSIWCYTGYIFEDDLLNKMLDTVPETKGILDIVDVIVDGPFVEELKNLNLKFRGSSNQRIIDVKKSIKQGKTVLFSL